MIITDTSGKTATPLLRKHNMAVSNDGSLVSMHIGNVQIDLTYETALQLSVMLRVHGKRVKNLAGDGSRHWMVVGMMEDAESYLLEAQKRKWA